MSYLLFADDDEAMRGMVRDLLVAAGHEVALAVDGPSALAAAAAREPDLLILDLNMPGMSGLDVCRRMKGNPFTERIPILMLTGLGALERKLEGFAAGADDYLPKPFDPRELRARVDALLRLVRREGDRNPTSGLPGGRAIEAELERRVARGAPFGVCYLDFDHFKAFCDTFGFGVADAVIRATGRLLRDVVEGAGAVEAERAGEVGDFVGHIGGDDFVVVTSETRAESIARDCVREFPETVARVLRDATGMTVADTFTGVDRDGEVRRFPLARMTAAVLIVGPERWASTYQLGAVAADVKRRARSTGAGTILVEAV